MPRFSATSRRNLETCHRDLQILFNTVVHHFDCAVKYGHRGEREQNAMQRAGTSQKRYPNSKHNKKPSMAADVYPYPIAFEDRERMHFFAGYVLGVAEMLYYEGLMIHRLRWGGDWDGDTEVKDNSFDDLGHFELIGV